MTSLKKVSRSDITLYLVLVLLGLALPYVISSDYIVHVIIMGYIAAIAIYGLNLIMGYTGQLSLAHAAFFAIGAYTAGALALKLHWSFWLALPAACALTSLTGLLVGSISLRLKSHYFAVFTLCVGVIINLVIQLWDPVTGGVVGLIGVPAPNPIPLPGGGAIAFTGLHAQYYLIFVFFLLTVVVMGRIVNSMVGRTFVAIRNSEELASTIGINVFSGKLLSFVISAFFAGLAGVLYAGYIRFLGPPISDTTQTFDFLLTMLVGGQASLAGPIVGSLLVSVVDQTLQVMQSYRMLVFGPFLILVVMFFPGGLVGGYHSLKKRYREGKRQEVPLGEAIPSATVPGKRQVESEELRG